jgi:hypothetical protein
LLFVLLPFLAEPAISNHQGDVVVNSETRVVLVDAVAKAIEDNYEFPDRAEKMARSLRERSSSHQYDGITSGDALAKRLTQDLYEIGDDRHIRVFQPGTHGEHTSLPIPGAEAQEQREAAWVNYGFSEVKRLAGNVGYLKVDRLLPTEAAVDTANTAMKFLSNVSALIIDLRDNHGGSPEMVRLLCTYLFEPGRRVHLNDFQWRGQPQLVESYTLGSVPGRSFADKPVFVLTSHHTFSAAEELAYDLQSVGRATIVGEVTGGGANPGRVFPLPEGFWIFVPTGRAINPVTKTNWEGVGVKPDIEVPENLAIDAAHLAALRAITRSSHLEPAQQQEIREAIMSIQKRMAEF